MIVPLRVGNHSFEPGLAGTLATLVMLPFLFSLGVWQLHRAEEKRSLAAMATAGQHSTRELSSATAIQLPRYQRVHARGRYDSQRQLLLDNMPSHAGAPGYHVLTPLLLDDGGMVLIDRGWVELGPTRAQLPAIGLPQSSAIEVHGVLDTLPQAGVRLGTPDIRPVWPKVLSFPQYHDLQQLYGAQLLAPIVLLDPSEPWGFDREWQISFGFGPERHVGYAVQWFALAAALLVIYFSVNLKRRPQDSR